MKYLKTLGLAVVAAAALMAFVGAGTASATELCKATENPCSNANMYGDEVGNTTSEIHAELKTGTLAILKAGFAKVECKKSTVLATVSTTGTNGSEWNDTPGGPITPGNLKFEECNCEVNVVHEGELKVHTDKAGTVDDNGIVTGRNSEVTIKCGSVSCIFGTAKEPGSTEIGTLDGGSDPVLTANAKLPWFAGDASNSICTLGSGTGAWTAEYTLTQPLYVI